MALETIEVEENSGAFIAYSSSTSSAYKFNGSPKPSATQPDDIEDVTGDDIAYWGKANDFPQQVEKHIESNPDLGNVLLYKALKLYSYGVTYKIMKEDEEGNAVYIDKIIPEVEQFLKRNRDFALKACIEMFRYYNVFPEITLSLDRKEIRYISCKTTKECRYSLMDEILGYSKYVYLSPNWHLGGTVKDKKTVKIPCINPVHWPAELVKSDRKEFNYILPISFPTGKKYYQLATWYTIIFSDWLKLANSIPKFKLALMNNQITIKYHIQMPDYWMRWKYPKFDSLDKKKQKELIDAECKKFDDFLVGIEKSGKSITSVFKTDPATGKEWPGWRIIPIDDKIKDGKYIEDAQEATTKIYSSAGVDPALGGFSPGKSGANRNGSDKREAGNDMYTINFAFEELLMQIYDYVADFNGWNDKYGYMVFGFIKAQLQTLNQVTPSKREAGSQHDPIQD